MQDVLSGIAVILAVYGLALASDTLFNTRYRAKFFKLVRVVLILVLLLYILSGLSI
jgi:hypothetical protein